jgi:GNAT superfamily N-acetyltransferase
MPTPQRQAPAFRPHGIGRMLTPALLDQAARISNAILANAATGSERFWESLGFLPDKRDGHTHLLMPEAEAR